ncbi:phage portal protein [Rickettsia hoogstraalii]|uniref:phage portal protein n=1 Tax=Rickettsia hoogstraalii TaxID=467174 RepID=UPI00069378EA|nr:phage portal protein [Rickettsia hoogstraalii]
MKLPNILSLFKCKEQKRGYEAAAINRLTSDWITSGLSADAQLYRSLRLLRNRSRELCINNDYACRFLKRTSTNVIGSSGIKLQVRATDNNGNFLNNLNNQIMEKFEKWSSKGNVTACGKLSWIDCQRLFLESMARDGEVILRLLKGFDNEFSFTLQFIEADHLDEELNKPLAGGNYIRMGIEFNKWNKPVAYHLLQRHPGEVFNNQTIRDKYLRIPAGEIIHAFIIDRSSQSRGVPWMHSAMLRLRMLAGYEEAELVAARVGAFKMGFFVSPDGSGYLGSEDSRGNKLMEAEPGTFEQLPAGMDVRLFDPNHPTSSFADFEKSILRGIASGLDISYATLANDLENVNFSSIRHGSLEDRDSWRGLQNFMIEHFCNPVFENWLLMAITTNKVPIQISEFDKFNKPIWRPRGWAWVDPLKDNHANQIALEQKTKSRSQIIAEQGLDIEELFKQLVFEEELAKKYGLNLETPNKEQTTQSQEGNND